MENAIKTLEYKISNLKEKNAKEREEIKFKIAYDNLIHGTNNQNQNKEALKKILQIQSSKNKTQTKKNTIK